MKVFYLLFISLLIVVEVKSEEVIEKKGSVIEKKEVKEKKVKYIDPVCGMEIEVKSDTPSVEVDGKTYYFCSESCKEKFIKKRKREKGRKGDMHHDHMHDHEKGTEGEH